MFFRRKTIAGIAELRSQLASAERQLRELTEQHAGILKQREHAAWAEARDACLDYDRIRARAQVRVAQILDGVPVPGKHSPERFPGEMRLALMALCEADRADAAYTVISFGGTPEKVRYAQGGDARDSLLREAMERGGVYNERNYFVEVIRSAKQSS
jgi:hypothetical protein